MGRQGTTRSDAPHEGLSHRVGAYASAHRIKRRWLAVLSFLAAVVVCVTTYALTMPASTMTRDLATLPEGAQVPEGYTQIQTTRDENNGFAVTVYAPEGAVPEGATLKADLIAEGTDAYVQAEQAVAATQPEVQSEGGEKNYGFAALDIRFEDAEGNEVELASDVYVSIDAAGLLPEDADPESVTVQHLAEDEAGAVASVDTVADAASETEGVVTATVAEDANTVQAAFAVDGFSTFTITWNSNWWQAITIHCVDESGNEIGSDSDDLNLSSAITMSQIAPEISGYTYRYAKVAWRGTDNGTFFTRLKYDNGWQCRTSNNGRWQDVDYRGIYLVYSKNPVELTTVDTVDSTAEGVHMYMRDFSEKAFNGGEYGSGDVKEDLATETVNQNGWPQLTGASSTPNGRSFAQVFFGNNNLNAYNLSDQYAVNHLFLQKYYEEDGTFYYSSFDNFATLENDNDSNFTVYEQLGSPSREKEYFYQRGNFMPYNTLDTDDVVNHNLYDSEGNRLPSDNERNNEDIYGFNESNNFHFGMYVWADFYQPEDGMVVSNDGSTSKEMVFEFTGDDDMWVYIDGVLVLDLGGIHDAQSGSINFASGEVRFTDTKTDQNPVWNSTTIKAQYEAAGRANNYDWDGNTFADGSSHRIQIFYMERGEGASNLKISFNLKTIPDGQLSVTKDVENYYAPQVADIEYTMQVTVNGEAYANAEYTILGDEDTVLHTDSNGQFKLKHDQTATFPDLQVGDTVTVKEVGSADTEPGVTIDENYDITYTVTDGAGNTTGDTGEDGTVTAVMPGYGSIRVTVNNKATYTRPLKVVKNFDGTDGNAAPEGFEATYTLYEVSDNGEKTVIGSVKYSDFTNGEYVFWLDTNKNYTVVESFGEGDNYADTDTSLWQRVDTTTNDPAEGTQASTGIVYLDENDATLDNATTANPVDTITLTNVYGDTDIDIIVTKVSMDDHATKLSGAIFYLKNSDGLFYSYDTESDVVSWVETEENAMPLTSGNEGTFVIKGVESGVYTLVETKSPDGYQLPTTVFTFTVSDGRITDSTDKDHGDTSLTVENTPGGAVLPETGGPGTTFATIGGIALVAAAGCGYGLRRSRERRGDQR